MPATVKMELELDLLDAEAIIKAIKKRTHGPMPDGEGNLNGRVLAEICRGWLEYLEKGS